MSKINSINIWKLLKIFEKYLKNKKKIMYNLKKDINKYVNVLILNRYIPSSIAY